MDKRTPYRFFDNANVNTTIEVMKKLANDGKKDIGIRALVEDICKDIASGDYTSEALAIYYWVVQNIRYMRDPAGVEMVKQPSMVVETRAGDCDDMATLIAAMLASAGNPVNFSAVGFSQGGPPSHIFAEVPTPSGSLALDPVANKVTAKMLGDIKTRTTINVTGGELGAGVGRSPHVGESGFNVYSVFDYRLGEYIYFEDGRGSIPATGSYRPSPDTDGIGIAPEDAAAALPPMAREVGRGDGPRGIIASRSRISSGVDGRWFKYAAIITAIYLWKKQ